jgi:hypothetical protein
LTSDAKPELIYNVGLVVNFVEKTVSFAGFVAPFVKVDAANISFNGVNNTPLSERGPAVSISVYGNIDRITGAVEATTASTALTSY